VNQSVDDPRADAVDISVVIVNWNTRDLLKKCLESVYKTIHDLPFEVIVVDNNSSDGSADMLREEFPSVITLINRENRGFGAANNQAFAVMKGRYALLLNSDAMLTPQAVRKLWDFCETNKKAGIVCGQLLNADGSKQNSIAPFPSLLTLALNQSFLEVFLPQIYPSKRYGHKEPIEVDSAIGACLMARKKALDEAGFFDERYFFFFEETDLARAMRCRNWKVYQVPDAYIYHLQGQSVGHQTTSRIEFYRSRYQFLRKWHGNLYYYSAKIIILVRLLMNCLSHFILVLLTFGLHTGIREKFITYSGLIRWHIHPYHHRQ